MQYRHSEDPGVTEQPLDIYQPRAVENLGVWPFDGRSLKAYGIVADGQGIDAAMQVLARLLVNQEVLPRVETEGASNGMGFIFIHPGALGLTISSHWWCQGSVLCQHNYRKPYAASQQLNTRDRTVVA